MNGRITSYTPSLSKNTRTSRKAVVVVAMYLFWKTLYINLSIQIIIPSAVAS
jgi:hypothetical protein